MKNYYIESMRKGRHTLKIKKANWICHILHRNCLLKYVIERRIEVMGRTVRRRKQLLDDFTEKRILEKCKRKH
jgi:hypothetical protein